MGVFSVPDYQGGITLNHHLIMFLKYVFKNQVWDDENIFKWSEIDRERSVDVVSMDPETEIARSTVVVGYPTTSNPLISFDAQEGMDPSNTAISRTYNFEYDIEFKIRAFELQKTAALADMVFLVLTHPQFCSALEKATHIRPDVRQGNFTKSNIDVKPATGTIGSSGSFEYEISMRGKYIITMNVELDYIDADIIEKEVVSFLREE